MLWFDITNIWMRKSSVLTGTQRTSLNILKHLLATREDVRLFRFDRKLGALREVVPDTPEPGAWIASTPKAGANAKLSTSSWSERRARLWPQLRQVPARVRLVAGSSSGVPDDMLRAALQPLFQPGDIVLSMSTSRGQKAYAEAIVANSAGQNVKYISFIYDLIPALFPQWVAEGAAARFERWVTRELERADMLLTISQYQKAELAGFMARKQIAAKPIEVVYLGDEHLGGTGGSVVEPAHPPRSPFVLCVGVLDARKNHYALYHAWRRLAAELGEDCPRLVLIGRRFMLSDDLLYQIDRDPIVNKLIVHLQDVPDAELAWYFRNCLFTMFPSHYEGWGLPVAESLHYGKLCIASNASSIPEIGGDLVDYFDPIDIASCYRLTHRAVTDEAYREGRMSEIKLRYVARSWSAAAETVNQIVDDLQRRR